jgi:hypothetical protein
LNKKDFEFIKEIKSKLENEISNIRMEDQKVDGGTEEAEGAAEATEKAPELVRQQLAIHFLTTI